MAPIPANISLPPLWRPRSFLRSEGRCGLRERCLPGIYRLWPISQMGSPPHLVFLWSVFCELSPTFIRSPLAEESQFPWAWGFTVWGHLAFTYALGLQVAWWPGRAFSDVRFRTGPVTFSPGFRISPGLSTFSWSPTWGWGKCCYMINSKHMLHRNAESYHICPSFTTEELSFSCEPPRVWEEEGGLRVSVFTLNAV